MVALEHRNNSGSVVSGPPVRFLTAQASVVGPGEWNPTEDSEQSRWLSYIGRLLKGFPQKVKRPQKCDREIIRQAQAERSYL